MFLCAMAFVAAGLWLYANADQIPHRDPLYVKAVAIACVGFFAACGASGCAKLFDAAPGLIIDAEGIVVNSGGMLVGRIPWSEINGFRIEHVRKHKFLIIEVQNPDKYAQRGNFLTRQLVAANMKRYGGIPISALMLKIGFDELLKVVGEFDAKYRRA